MRYDPSSFEEYIIEIRWAGDPDKSSLPASSNAPLTPRRSFAEWKRTVRQQSQAWSRIDHLIARDLHAGLLRLIAQRSVELIRINEELLRVNAALNSFAYAASHVLKEPLRTINQTLSFLQRALDADDMSEARRRAAIIGRTSQRMNELLEGLLRVSRAGSSDLHLEPIMGLDHSPPPRAMGLRAIYVGDDGIGIARECLQDVFQVFRRLHQQNEFGGGSVSDWPS